MEEGWNEDVNPTTISPDKGMFLAAISQHNVVPNTLMTFVAYFELFPDKYVPHLIVTDMNKRAKHKNAGRF
jgi:hypothetical protein